MRRNQSTLSCGNSLRTMPPPCQGNMCSPNSQSICLQIHANVITKGVQEIIEAISKKGAQEATQELAEFGGKKAIQATLEKAAREGGEELVEKVVKYGRRYAVSAVRVINNVPAHYIKALDGLPEELIERAVWAVQREPEVMTTLVRDYGAEALLIAAKHRGIGGNLVSKLGVGADEDLGGLPP